LVNAILQQLSLFSCSRLPRSLQSVAVTLRNQKEKPPLAARLGRQITNRVVTTISEAKAVAQFTHFWAG
jgi:hypothetical protein